MLPIFPASNGTSWEQIQSVSLGKGTFKLEHTPGAQEPEDAAAVLNAFLRSHSGAGSVVPLPERLAHRLSSPNRKPRE